MLIVQRCFKAHTPLRITIPAPDLDSKYMVGLASSRLLLLTARMQREIIMHLPQLEGRQFLEYAKSMAVMPLPTIWSGLRWDHDPHVPLDVILTSLNEMRSDLDLRLLHASL